MRYQKDRFRSRYSDSHLCGADLFVGDGVRSRIARHDCGNRAEVADFFDSLGACHGRLVDLLLQGAFDGDINKVVPIDKSSTILTVLLAIICFGETSNFVFKLIATVILALGIFLMVEKKKTEERSKGRSWMIYAVLSAVFAALTSILAKVGISGVESNLGTAIRTCVVLVMAWGIVLARGKQKGLPSLDKKELLFI